MRFLKLFSLSCCLLFGTLACQPATSDAEGAQKANPTFDPDNLSEVFQLINQEVLDHSRAYESLDKAIREIGHRLTGSENGKAAEEFAFNLLREYGLEEVEYFPFSVEAWSRESVSLKIDDGSGYQDFPVVSLAHSPVAFDGEAELVDVGNGLRSDFELGKAQVAGKMVLLNLHLDGSDPLAKNLHRTEKTALAIEYGAKGVIFVNGVNGNVLLTGAASVTGELIPIPAVCIGKESGALLRNGLVNTRQKAHISMRNHADRISARNVIARIPGSELPDEKIIIGGHLDSWDLSTGAIDNGIGSFTVLEIARTFKKLGLRPRRTVEFALFMGEEQGLLGSTALVEHFAAQKQLGQVRYVINLDMSGNAIGFRSMGRKEVEPWLIATGAKIEAIDSTFKNKVGGKAGLHSDHQPFMLQGIPVLGIWSNLDPGVYDFYHSDGDDFELVDKDHMNNCARFTAMMLYAMANAKTLPAKRQTPEQTRDFLVAQGLKEKLVLGEEWKW